MKNGVGEKNGWTPTRSSALLAVLALVGATGCRTDHNLATATRSPEDRLEQGLSLLRRGEGEVGTQLLQGLVTELEAQVPQESHSTRQRVLLATAYHALGKTAIAISTLETAAALDPASLLASYDLGQIHQVRREDAAALRWFQQAARAGPDDWRTHVKLVQVFQALGRTADRERARAKLFELRRARGTSEEEFCREQFQANGYDIKAFERLVLEGQWAIRYRFEATHSGTPRMVRFLTLGSYRVTTDLARLRGEQGHGERLFHLDGYGPGGGHQTYAFYGFEPTYDDVRNQVMEILKGGRQVISEAVAGSMPGAQARRVEDSELQIQKAALFIDKNAARDYVVRTFGDLMRLAPSVSIDPDNRITVTGLVGGKDVGTALMASLANSRRRVIIAFTPYGNAAQGNSWRDATNGRGTDVLVRFNPDRDPSLPTVRPDGRVEERRGRPAFIGLGHELVHALHIVNGTLAGAVDADGTLLTIFGRHSFRDSSGVLVGLAEDKEELDTIGVGGYGNGPTENDLRREHNLPLRGAHGLGDVP